MKILRNFGLGIVWALLTPFILVGAVVIAAYGIVVFFIEMIITIINFFKGEKVFPLPKEDIEAMRVLQKALDNQGANGTQVSNNSSTVMIQQNYYGPAGYPNYPYPQGTLPPQGNPNYPGIPPQQMPGMLPPNMNPQQQGMVPPSQSFPAASEDGKEDE